MKKYVFILIICLSFLSLGTKVKAEDPLTPDQRAWLNNHGTLQVGAFDYYPPFGFLDKFGEPQGMSIDFWRLLSSKLQFWMQFTPTMFSQQLEGLKTGKYDSLAGIFDLNERRQWFDFSKPYTVIRTHIYVKPKYANLKTLEDLKDLNVSAVLGDSGYAICEKRGLNPKAYSNYREAVFDVAYGSADAIVMDELVVAYFIKEQNLKGKIIKTGQPVDEGKMCLPVIKGNTTLLDILNTGIDMVSKEDWRRIEESWLGKQD
ncbi:MAG TPA: transporter substrate-binding domain-containing protein [Desulfatiglandales bacterium]|nr:transporter substrate-binding domain-containing protein [Desulfatiglandales bacterium]